MKRLVFFVIATSMISACSTKPTMNATTVAPMLYNTVTADTATVKITRDSGVLGSACNTYVFVDDKQVASLRPAESATLYVPRGRHILSFNTSRGLCPSATDAIDVILNKGDIKNYRIRGDMNCNFQLLPTL
jgi:hypothetical protein